MDEKNEQDVDLNNDADDQADDLEVESATDDGNDSEKKEEKPKRTPEEQMAYLEGRTARLRKKLGLTETRKPKEPKTGEIDKADYAYFAAKGYDEDEDIEFLQDKMKKWNLNSREILKDEDVLAKLKGMKLEREVKAATPGSTRRSQADTGVSNIDYWIAKFERTGEYPADFDLKSAVVNAMVDKSNPNKPSWR